MPKLYFRTDFDSIHILATGHTHTRAKGKRRLSLECADCEPHLAKSYSPVVEIWKDPETGAVSNRTHLAYSTDPNDERLLTPDERVTVAREEKKGSVFGAQLAREFGAVAANEMVKRRLAQGKAAVANDED